MIKIMNEDFEGAGESPESDPLSEKNITEAAVALVQHGTDGGNNIYTGWLEKLKKTPSVETDPNVAYEVNDAIINIHIAAASAFLQNAINMLKGLCVAAENLGDVNVLRDLQDQLTHLENISADLSASPDSEN